MHYVYKILKSVDGASIKKIYQSVGWDDGDCSVEILAQLATNSFLFAGAFDENENLVGMGRVLSDGLSDACIQDIAVLKEHQKKGIGKEIMQLLIAECQKCGIDWIQLIASKDGYHLYESLGFEVMDGFVPMKLKN